MILGDGVITEEELECYQEHLYHLKDQRRLPGGGVIKPPY